MTTKKVKQLAKFGTRYGVGIRKRLLKIESRQRAKQECPFCGFKKVKREAPGIYVCSKCESKFAGGAYLPSTDSGKLIKKMVDQKSFMSNTAELLAVRENAEKEIGEDKEKESGPEEAKEEKPSAVAKKKPKAKKKPRAAAKKKPKKENKPMKDENEEEE